MNPEDTIKIIVDRIVSRFHPEKIVLFGSYARGVVTPDSDIDLLIVISKKALRREIVWAIEEELADIRIPKDIIVRTADEIERFKDIVGTIVRPALKEGKVLYER